jgi:hypothetical protein
VRFRVKSGVLVQVKTAPIQSARQYPLALWAKGLALRSAQSNIGGACDQSLMLLSNHKKSTFQPNQKQRINGSNKD